MKLVVGCPVSNRNWILPEWNQHVLSSVFDLVERDSRDWDLEYAFVVPSGDTETLSVLSSFDTSTFTLTRDEPEVAVRRRWGPDRYQNMVESRNALLGLVRELSPDFFLSLDSDILLHPTAISKALELFRDGVWAVGLATYLTPRGNTVPNMGSWLDQSYIRYSRKDYPEATTCDILMAAKLMKPEAYQVDYEYHRSGEDLGWSRALKRAGGKVMWDGRVKNKHVMEPEHLSQVDERVGF